MGLGFLDIPYESVVVRYDDEETPKSLTGVKMLPIFQFENGESMNESLDILRILDINNSLKHDLLLSDLEEKVSPLLDEIGKNVHSLCMPYWVWTPEFDDKSRHYFQSKKEVKRGPFKNLIKNKDQYLNPLNELLSKLENDLKPFFHSEKFSILDIMIASHLWGMYIFPEFQFSDKIHSYLQEVKRITKFDYHQDYWA